MDESVTLEARKNPLMLLLKRQLSMSSFHLSSFCWVSSYTHISPYSAVIVSGCKKPQNTSWIFIIFLPHWIFRGYILGHTEHIREHWVNNTAGAESRDGQSGCKNRECNLSGRTATLLLFIKSSPDQLCLHVWMKKTVSHAHTSLISLDVLGSICHCVGILPHSR